MCQCNKQNCGCTPSDYTSSMTYDGLVFSCPALASLKPNCVGLNKVLETFGEEICKLIEATTVVVLPINGWDMDANASLVIDLPTFNPIGVTEMVATIYNDAESSAIPLLSAGNIVASSGFITLSRDAAGTFDAPTYASEAINRGYLTIKRT